MSDIMTVAQGTFERFARIKSLYLILLICIMDVAAMGLYNELTLGLDKELMVDCALAIITVVGLLSAMVVAFDVPRELREKTAQFILTKPTGRTSFVWGKFLGVSALAVFNIAIVTVGALFVIHAKYGEFNSSLVYAALLVAGEALVLVGAGLVFSMFLADSISAIGVFVVFFLGHSLFMLPRYWISKVASLIYYVFPSFYNLDIKTEVGAGIAVPSDFVIRGIIYAVCYALALVGLSTIIFSRKDIS
ncbi:MAG: ABC transporter permease subunit [Planctomycetota bacterium]|jgi:ABC-type transport system involved in multi-copper enzyme maturation permease subunit